MPCIDYGLFDAACSGFTELVTFDETCFYSEELTIKKNFFSLPFRTNSDSALHQSTMTPAQQESFSGGSQDMQQKRGKQRKTVKVFVAFKALYFR